MFDSPIELLQAMVRIPSVHPAICGDPESERPLAEWVEKALFHFGVGWRRLDMPGRGFQVLAAIPATTPNAPVVLFESHLDTVGVDGMTIDPFGGALHEEKVWGRGACDTKGTGAALLWALKNHLREKERPNTVLALFALGEEASMDGIQHFCAHILPTLNPKPSLAIVGEPTELAVLAGHNGAMRLDLTVTGKACHSSVPHEGANALHALAAIALAIEAHSNTLPEDPLCGKPACSVTLAQGGGSPNVIPGTATATIDRRIGPGESAAQAKASLRTLIETTIQDRTGIQFDLQVSGSVPPLPTTSAGPFHQTIRNTLRDLGHTWPLLGAGYCTDASWLHQAGIPTLVCGPGSMHKAHQADEWVEAEQIHAGAAAYAALMQLPLKEDG